MIWTTNKPTEPGWYWWRTKFVKGGDWYEGLLNVIEYPLGSLYVKGYGNLETMNGQWAGPILPPEEP
jgi:hypothetical protein